MASSPKFIDVDDEKKALAGLLLGPSVWRSFPEAWVTDPVILRTYEELKKFLHPPYSTFPTAEMVVETCEDPDVKLMIKEIATIKVEPREVPVFIRRLYEMYARRKVHELVLAVPDKLAKMDIEVLIREQVSTLSGIVNPLEGGLRERGFIYEAARERWMQYMAQEKDPQHIPRLPFHIGPLDQHTSGGIRIPHIVLFYAKTGGFKTKTMGNLAYNWSFLEGKDVMVITLEVPKDDYEHIMDSRHALLDYNRIVTGKLEQEREKYRQSLMEISRSKPSLYIVDIPDKATSVDIQHEWLLYHAKFGKFPDVCIVDYANEMEPVTPWKNTSEKFKNLGVEFRRLSRTFKVSIATAMMENREGAKLKDQTKSDLEHIGESHYFSNVCHLVVHVYQDDIDIIENQLHMSIKKNRYGPKNETFVVYANPAYNYVGDRRVHEIPINTPTHNVVTAVMTDQPETVQVTAIVETPSLEIESEGEPTAYDNEETQWTGTNCSVCSEPQYQTPSGVTCINGHGGALPA